MCATDELLPKAAALKPWSVWERPGMPVKAQIAGLQPQSS